MKRASPSPQQNVFEKTSHQRVLGFLSLYPDKAYFGSEISRAANISLGAASNALRELTKAQLLIREKKGKMYFYSVDLKNPLVRQFKVIQNISSLADLMKNLKEVSERIVLFGSAASGTNLEDSDIDLFILANDPRAVAGVVNKSKLAEKVQLVAKKPIDLPSLKRKDSVFYEEISKGLVLWEKRHDQGV